jgi:Flp pilus assembly protein TadD
MIELDISVIHQINSILGWLELNDPKEARVELEQLPEELRQTPELLEVRWLVDASDLDWDKALETAKALLRAAPDSPEGWLHQAYALRRASSGGLDAARAALEPAAPMFPDEPTIPYNLACYTCQLGRLDEARELLKASILKGGARAIKEMALKDPDLEALWKEIRALK